MHWKKPWWEQAGKYPASNTANQSNDQKRPGTEPSSPSSTRVVAKESKMPDHTNDIKYMMTVEAAEYLRLSPRTLERMRVDGTGPKFHKAGPGKRARVLYRRSDLREWLEGMVFTATSQYGG